MDFGRAEQIRNESVSCRNTAPIQYLQITTGVGYLFFSSEVNGLSLALREKIEAIK